MSFVLDTSLTCWRCSSGSDRPITARAFWSLCIHDFLESSLSGASSSMYWFKSQSTGTRKTICFHVRKLVSDMHLVLTDVHMLPITLMNKTSSLCLRLVPFYKYELSQQLSFKNFTRFPMLVTDSRHHGNLHSIGTSLTLPRPVGVKSVFRVFASSEDTSDHTRRDTLLSGNWSRILWKCSPTRSGWQKISPWRRPIRAKCYVYKDSYWLLTVAFK